MCTVLFGGLKICYDNSKEQEEKKKAVLPDTDTGFKTRVRHHYL